MNPIPGRFAMHNTFALFFARYCRRPSALLLAICCGSAVHAQDAERSWNLGLALGQGQRSNPLINGENIDINAVVDLSWYGEHFFFDNGDFGVTLSAQRAWSLNVVATFNNERHYYSYLTGRSFGLDSLVNRDFGINNENFGDGEAPAPDAHPGDQPVGTTGLLPAALNLETELADRDFALQSGMEFLYISPWGDVQAQLLSDVSSTHGGQEAWLSWSRPWYTRNNEFALTVGLEWKSADLVSYYYGVREEEAFPGRPAYAAGSGSNLFIRFAARHALSQHWQLAAMVEREFLSSAISNSPIVADAAVDTFFAGLFYQF